MSMQANDNQSNSSASPLHESSLLLLAWTAFERLPMRTLIVDQQGLIVMCNAAWRRYISANGAAENSSFVGTRFYDVCTAAPDLEAAEKQLIIHGVRELLSGAQPEFILQYPCYSSTNQRWFSLQALPIEIGGQLFALVTHQEETARRKAELALDQSRQRLQAIFDNTLDAILLADDQANYVDGNPAATALLGYTRDELRQLSLADLAPASNASQTAQAWSVFLAQGVSSGEFAVRHKDGSIVETEFRAVANIIPGLHLSALRDITERKRAQTALQESHAQLRQLARRLDKLREQQERTLAHTLTNRLGQNLAALGIHLRLVRNRLTHDLPEALDARVATMQQLLDGVFAELHVATTDLRPTILDDHGLAATLRWYGAQFARHSGLVVETVLDETPELARPPLEVETALFRITQEALARSARHAGAYKVVIKLDLAPDATTLLIDDDGDNFQRTNPAEPGDETRLGLISMYERAVAVNGTLEIFSLPPTGTRIFVRVPR